MNTEVSPVQPAPSARYEVHHYPANLIDMRTLPDGRRAVLRPVLPQDQPLLAELVSHLSAGARRNRFHGAFKPGAAQLQRMACIDYRHELAFVVTACQGATECVVADARYCVDADGQGAEFALMVDEAWQRLGLGCWAMQALLAAAQAAGLKRLHGDILGDNAAMQTLAQRCGLSCRVDPQDDQRVQALWESGHPLAEERPRMSLARQVRRWRQDARQMALLLAGMLHAFKRSEGRA